MFTEWPTSQWPLNFPCQPPQQQHRFLLLTDPRYLASLAGEELLVALDMSTIINSSDASHSISSCDLIYCAPQADSLDESNTHLPIKMSTLFRYPKMRLRTDLLDPHCYLFSLGIFGMIEEIINNAGGSMSAESALLIGNNSNESLNSASPLMVSNDLIVPASLFSLREDLIPKVLTCPPIPQQRRNRQETLQHFCNYNWFRELLFEGEYPTGFTWIHEAIDEICCCLTGGGVKVAASAEISPKSQVGNDSLFGESSRLGERSSVKKSVVGNCCTLGNNVKIVNCIVMDGAVIEDGCKLDGCIVGPKALIRGKVPIEGLWCGGRLELQKEQTAKGETFGSNRELVEDLY